MLGHASAAMTLDVYAGLFSPDDAAERLDEAARAAAVSCLCPDDADESDVRSTKTSTTRTTTGRRGVPARVP